MAIGEAHGVVNPPVGLTGLRCRLDVRLFVESRDEYLRSPPVECGHVVLSSCPLVGATNTIPTPPHVGHVWKL